MCLARTMTYGRFVARMKRNAGSALSRHGVGPGFRCAPFGLRLRRPGVRNARKTSKTERKIAEVAERSQESSCVRHLTVIGCRSKTRRPASSACRAADAATLGLLAAPLRRALPCDHFTKISDVGGGLIGRQIGACDRLGFRKAPLQADHQREVAAHTCIGAASGGGALERRLGLGQIL